MFKLFFTVLTLTIFSKINCSAYSNDYFQNNIPSSINLPIFSNQKVLFKNVASHFRREKIPEIVISSGPMKMKMIFESQSTQLDVSNKHTNSDGKTLSSSSQDGEIVLKHHVTKPIKQYVSEEIVPTRYLSQKVRPVKEYIKTIVSKNDKYAYKQNSNSAEVYY